MPETTGALALQQAVGVTAFEQRHQTLAQTIAVIIPALEEGKTITNVLHKLAKFCPGAHVVVIDGGSLDGTAEKAQLSKASVVVEPRHGYGRAIRSGIHAINADLYVIVDADDTYDLSVLPEMIRLASSGAIVIGRRLSSSQGSMSTSHIVGNKILSLAYRILFNQRVQDTQSGFKIFSREVASLLREDGMSLSSEILITAHRLNLATFELPVEYYPRHNGSTSKFNFWNDGIPVLLYLVFSRAKSKTRLREAG